MYSDKLILMYPWDYGSWKNCLGIIAHFFCFDPLNLPLGKRSTFIYNMLIKYLTIKEIIYGSYLIR